MPGLIKMPRIDRLDLATVEIPENHPAAASGRTVPVYGFCIHHPDGPLLVDSGVGFGNRLIDELYHPERQHLDAALGRLDVVLDDIVAVINSHLHFDHCGQNPLLFDGQTSFFAQAEEVDAVAQDPQYTDQGWALAPEPKRRLIRGDEQIADGVTVVATPGHTAGHQSVVIEAGGRRVVIGAQLVWHGQEFSSETASEANVDPDPDLQSAAIDSIKRIKALRPEVVHFSHCPAYRPA